MRIVGHIKYLNGVPHAHKRRVVVEFALVIFAVYRVTYVNGRVIVAVGIGFVFDSGYRRDGFDTVFSVYGRSDCDKRGGGNEYHAENDNKNR